MIYVQSCMIIISHAFRLNLSKMSNFLSLKEKTKQNKYNFYKIIIK